MAAVPEKIGDFGKSVSETRKYKEWVTTLCGPDEDGLPNRRSNSSPAEKRGHHPHIHDTLSQSPNNLTSQPLEVSKRSNRKNVQATFFDHQGRCPNEWSGFRFKLRIEEDVDGCQPKMRETSGSERKRKKHQHSSDYTHKIESEDVLITRSFEGITALPSNIEDEGEATSCKRVKLSTPQIKKFHHNNVVEALSHSKSAAVRSVDELANPPDHLTLDNDLTFVSIDGEARERKRLTGSGIATQKRTASGDFLARYKGPANNFPDYGYVSSVSKDLVEEERATEHLTNAPNVQPAAASALGRNKEMAGGKKFTSISGSFKPLNSLKNSDKNPSTLPRPKRKKAFDLHESNSTIAPDELQTVKKQKVGGEKFVRRESSGSIIEISGDGNHVEAGRNISSTSSTPKKTIQSVSSRSHYQNPKFLSRLGEVEEYKRTEAIVGFASKGNRKALRDEFERRASFLGEFESGARQHRISVMSEPSISTYRETPQAGVDGLGKTPILVDDLESEDVVELSQPMKASHSRTRNVTSRSTANDTHASTEQSHYFVKPKKRGKAKNGFPHTGSSQAVVEAHVRGASSPTSFHSLDDVIDDVQNREGDFVDLLKLNDDSVRSDQKAESRVLIQDNITMKSSESLRSESISVEGNIPQSTFSGVLAKYEQDQTSQMLKSKLSFEVIHLQSGQKLLKFAEGYSLWKLQYDSVKKKFDILLHDLSINKLYPGLVLKPEKIHVVKYSNHSPKVVISRAIETSIGAAGQVLVEMENLRDGNRFAQSLKRLNHTIKLSLFGSSAPLDSIFATARRSTLLASDQHKDIALLTVKEARRAAEYDKMRDTAISSTKSTIEELNQPANIGRRRSSTSEQGDPNVTHRQSFPSRKQLNSAQDVPSSARIPHVAMKAKNELSSSDRLGTLNREAFYSSRPGTRASSAQWSGERHVQQPKSRSPSPLRWTVQNPSWKEERLWEASLTFPKEGKKKATVDARDIERLDEGEFLNDNLIAFFLRYLEDCLEKSRPELALRIYFHNTFFYETLTKGKLRSNNINYDAVKRWTSKVDLFSYDYIVVPVCEKLHWYVAIICNAPRLLRACTPENFKPQYTAEHERLPAETTPGSMLEEVKNDPKTPKTLDNSNEAVGPRSASPSVVTQVEHMSLEDQDQEWPEPDAIPDVSHSGTAQLQNVQTADELDDDSVLDVKLQNQGQSEDMRPKGKKTKRRSIPPARKYDPNDPRIITLDSLGQAHSPACSNLKEYLVCEAKERRNVDIIPSRLGMTAKGLPQQSNYCDCGVFVLGYIDNFLKNPDEFIHRILQGDVAGNRTGVKIEASKMRGEIRELIFDLHAEQIRDEKGRREGKSKGKKISNTEAEPKSQLANSRSSTTTETAAEPDKSELTEPNMQPAHRSVTGEVRHGMGAKTPETRRYSSLATGYGSGPAEGISPYLPNASRSKTSRHFPKNTTTPLFRTEDSEIMETPAPSIEDESTLTTKKQMSQNRDYLTSPNSTETSIPLDSPLHPASSEGEWLTSPDRKAEGGPKTHITFKEFAKTHDSPFQNTRHKRRREKTSEYIPVEINGSQEDRQLEVGETPPRKKEQEPSFEDLLGLPTRSQKSMIPILDDDQSPESKALRRNGARN